MVALTGVACSSFTITVLSAALATIADDLNSSVSVVTWVIAGPLLAFAVFTPMAGKLGDLHGHRRIYLIGFAGAALFSLLTTLATSAFMLIAVRILARRRSPIDLARALPLFLVLLPLAVGAFDRRGGFWSNEPHLVRAVGPALLLAVLSTALLALSGPNRRTRGASD